MQKFEFSIRTRDGQLIERLNIGGRTQEEAERKLRQIYHYCEIVRCNSPQTGETKQAAQPASVEDILSMIAKQESPSA